MKDTKGSNLECLQDEITQKRLCELTDKLIIKLERAIEELDDNVSRVTIKEKEIEYDDDGKKPIFERVTEREEISIEKGRIDRGALKQLASIIKEIKGKGSDDEEDDNSVEVLLSEDAKELSV
ncbi:MAG: hypothetical protein E7652_04660 [Ruminococcaceae bacterium]|nr:hypothetical protein [Oscillospiraceae bacterium]